MRGERFGGLVARMKAAGRNPGACFEVSPPDSVSLHPSYTTAGGMIRELLAFIYTDACWASGRFTFFAQSVFINLAVQGALTDSQFIGHLAPVATVLFQQQGNVIGFHFLD